MAGTIFAFIYEYKSPERALTAQPGPLHKSQLFRFVIYVKGD